MKQLSQISTCWPLLASAHEAEGAILQAAQRELLQRYFAAVRGYFRRSCAADELAADLSQEFAVRFLRGDFRQASPEKGRFRDYLRAALSHLAHDHHRREQAERRRREGWAERQASHGEADPFLALWREELLQQSWRELKRFEAASGQSYFTALRAKAQAPEARSAELAERLSAELGRPFTPDNVRQLLRRARRKFMELLRAEVARSLGSWESREVDEELAALGLAGYFADIGTDDASDLSDASNGANAGSVRSGANSGAASKS